ncbi:hypothetical protein QVD17_37731 [Tagetes erecta]|uniref:Uncharacterized protein n=1 Tax=Tagetes erecta TaxID=13708 RepID=A0AAD8JUJ6_TARER|nr:hypothetical protein QVD17_37731 [Tagetes erecta]
MQEAIKVASSSSFSSSQPSLLLPEITESRSGIALLIAEQIDNFERQRHEIGRRLQHHVFFIWSLQQRPTSKSFSITQTLNRSEAPLWTVQILDPFSDATKHTQTSDQFKGFFRSEPTKRPHRLWMEESLLLYLSIGRFSEKNDFSILDISY